MAAVVLVAPGRRRGVRLAANVVLATSSAVLHRRYWYGTDGADQVSMLAQGLATVARAGQRSPRIVDAALSAASLQGMMSYAASGLVKVASGPWGTGDAIIGVTRTRTYGDLRTWQLLRGRRNVAKALEIAVVALECVAPVVYIGGGRLTRPYVAAATVLHLGIAKVMSLGRFLTSFCSLHAPMIYTTAGRRNGLQYDRVTALAFGGGIGLVGAAAGHQALTRRTVERARGDEQRIELSDGNEISYRVVGDRAMPPEATGCAPVVMLEHGLASTPEHWEWIVRSLREHPGGATPTIVTWHRSGYGPSSHRPRTVRTMEDLAASSTELIERIASDRDVVLVGYSLGGYLAVLAAAKTQADVRGVVLVDTSHPDELRRSEKQRLGAERMEGAMTSMARSLSFGSGILLRCPPWVKALPIEVQRIALAQVRDPRTWRAGVREWDATQRDFDSKPQLQPLTCPMLVLTAGATRRDDPVQYELHAEMLELGDGGQHVTIDGANHDSIVTSRAHAAQVAEHINEFIATCMGDSRVSSNTNQRVVDAASTSEPPS
ncbi:MAG: alpha/beta fold hydrolase [Actinomycetota bacterium]